MESLKLPPHAKRAKSGRVAFISPARVLEHRWSFRQARLVPASEYEASAASDSSQPAYIPFPVLDPVIISDDSDEPLATFDNIVVQVGSGSYPDGRTYCYQFFKGFITANQAFTSNDISISLRFWYQDSLTTRKVIDSATWTVANIAVNCGDKEAPFGGQRACDISLINQAVSVDCIVVTPGNWISC